MTEPSAFWHISLFSMFRFSFLILSLKSARHGSDWENFPTFKQFSQLTSKKPLVHSPSGQRPKRALALGSTEWYSQLRQTSQSAFSFEYFATPF